MLATPTNPTSSPSNPIIFRFSGKIPALKNSKMAVALKGGRGAKLVMAPKVRQWIVGTSPSLKDQWRQQRELGFEQIDLPKRVVMVFYWNVYAAKEDSVPQADLDNAAASVQEILQSPDVWKQKIRGNELAVDVYHDDRQIIARYSEQVLVPNHALEGGSVYLWVHDPYESPFREVMRFQFFKESIDSRFSSESELPELVLEGLE